MADRVPIAVAIVYARPDRQHAVTITVPAGTTAREALRVSGLGGLFPEIDVEHCALGVFGRLVRADQALRAGDRVEIYRPLERDPRDARREAAERGDVLGGRASTAVPRR